MISRAHLPQIAVVLICGCTLVHLAVLDCGFWYRDATQERNGAERWIAKYEPLRDWLPADEAAQFTIDQSHADRQRLHPDARLYLARYAVSPKRLSAEATSRWVVVDSDCPDIEPAGAVSGRWPLIVDLRNGVRLYRIDPIHPCKHH